MPPRIGQGFHFLLSWQIACLPACFAIKTNNAPPGALFVL
jgi:hypothetical protein